MPSHQVVTYQVDKLLWENPEWREPLFQYQQRMSEGFFDQGLVDAIVQKSARSSYSSYTIHDAYHFAQVYAKLVLGHIILAKLEVGSEPMPDRMVKQNNEALSQLPYPFSAQFFGGPGDSDGSFSWSKRIKMSREQLEDGKMQLVTVEPETRVPLEVGTTNGNTTFFHLRLDRALARWPYGSTAIYMFKTIHCKDLRFDLVDPRQTHLNFDIK